MNLVAEATGDSEVRKVLAYPYSLVPADSRPEVDQPDIKVPARDDLSGQWVAPFIMAAVDTRVVHRSNALLGFPWGRDFRYDEGMLMGTGPLGLAKATGISAGMLVGMGTAAVGPVRRLLVDKVLPQPGTGPSEEAQQKGFFDLRFFGRTASGKFIKTKVTGDRDPGYGSTAKILGETAVALVELDAAALEGGIWTPASAFGDDLVNRLSQNAGLTFEVLA